MPPSVDSTSTQSACVTRSTQKQQDSSSGKGVHQDALRKKPEDFSSSRDTSSQRLSKRKEMGPLTQESKKNRSNSKAMNYTGPGDEFEFAAICIDLNADLPNDPAQRSHQENLSHNDKDDGFLKHAQLESDEERRVSSNVTEEVSIKSMVLHSENLARRILTEYEKEREIMTGGRLEIAAALAQLRECNNAAALEIENLRLENDELVRKEAATILKLDEIHRERGRRDGVAFVAALTLSKALMLIEKESSINSEVESLRLQNEKVLRESAEVETKGRLEIEKLKSSLIADLTQVRSEKAELLKEREKIKSEANLLTQKLLCHVAASNSEFEKLRSLREAFVRESEDAEARAADAVAVELNNLRSEKENLLKEIHWTFCREVEQLRIAMAAELTGMQRENELLREKAVNASKKLNSRFEAAVQQLQTAAVLEKDELRSEIAAKDSELTALNYTLTKMLAEKAQQDSQVAANLHKLRREKEESETREFIALEKLRSRTIFPRAISNMHLAFLINSGLLQPKEFDDSSVQSLVLDECI